MINKLIEKYKEKIFTCESTMILKDLEELKIEIDKLARDKNMLENYYYDDMYSKGKISKELYEKFKGLGVDTDE